MSVRPISSAICFMDLTDQVFCTRPFEFVNCALTRLYSASTCCLCSAVYWPGELCAHRQARMYANSWYAIDSLGLFSRYCAVRDTSNIDRAIFIAPVPRLLRARMRTSSAPSKVTCVKARMTCCTSSWQPSVATITSFVTAQSVSIAVNMYSGALVAMLTHSLSSAP